MPDTAIPLLWHFPVSHYNEKARWALDWKGVPHRRKALFVDYIPRAFLRTGQLSLPILILDGKAVPDSTQIIAAVEKRWPDPPLYPADPTLRRRALDLEDFFDEEVGHPLRTLLLADLWRRDPARSIDVLATGQPDAPVRFAKGMARLMRAVYRSRHAINSASEAEAPARVEAGLERVERELGPKGYLSGEGFSVADLTAAALLAPLVRPPELEYPVAEELLTEPALAYRAKHAGREAFAWVREMYRRHRGTSFEQPA
jgi:glutathione S-transferase